MDLNKLSHSIIECAIKVHSTLGPGLLESTYQTCLVHELKKRGLKVESEVPLPVIYDGEKIEVGYRIDILVENSIILEIKAIEKTIPIHEAQLLSYLKMSGKTVGLLLNFNVRMMKSGITRMVNDFKE